MAKKPEKKLTVHVDYDDLWMLREIAACVLDSEFERKAYCKGIGTTVGELDRAIERVRARMESADE